MGEELLNRNPVHDNDIKAIAIKDHKRSVFNMGFNDEQAQEIVEFYLFYAPILKPDENKKEQNSLKSLKEYGWSGSRLKDLEKQLLEVANIEKLYFIKSKKIPNSLKKMDLGETIFSMEPRAVMRQNVRVSVDENEDVKIEEEESRMVCLFRHIRNSLAHNLTYYFEDDMIMLEDREVKEIPARILLSKAAMLEWMKIVKQGK